MQRCATVASSHNCSAERQYRTPLGYGGQRAPIAQWTVTGAGAFVVEQRQPHQVGIVRGCVGIVKNMGIKDTANMGAAMAPAAADTLSRFFSESETSPDVYDGIFTGDLGKEGKSILAALMRMEGYALGEHYEDCGCMLYRQDQDTHAGGSGCGCSAVVLAACLLPKLQRGELKRVLLIGTGALMNPDSIKQGRDIPGIAHLIELRAPETMSEVEKGGC